MKLFIALLAGLLTLLASPVVGAQEPCAEGSQCVPPEDMKVFVGVLSEKQCLLSTQPEFKLDPITIVVDQDGRVYASGADPNPYTVKMTWCSYAVTATGGVTVVVARKEPEVWGFRFRPKFSSGFLFVEAFEREKALDAVDVGLLWDFLYWKSFNLNIATGIRSIGAGVGFDITRNFGAYLGYAFAYADVRHNPYAGLYFSFW